jgi:hypothetical protein
VICDPFSANVVQEEDAVVDEADFAGTGVGLAVPPPSKPASETILEGMKGTGIRLDSGPKRFQSVLGRPELSVGRVVPSPVLIENHVGRFGPEAFRLEWRLGRVEGAASRFDRAASRFDRAASRFDRAASRFDRAASRFDRAASRFDRVASRFDRAASRFDRAASRFDRVASRFDRVASRFDRAASRFDWAASRFD